jgi:hypothetical protein
MNEMSDNRKKCIELIKTNSNVKLELITPENISSWIKDPLHESYDYLSLTHKADYLRAYLMKHYGSGYCDIKPVYFDWNPYFDILENNSQFDFIGYSERHPDHIASDKEEIKWSYMSLCGCCHFIFKENTVFATKWLDKVHEILNFKKDKLQKYPGNYHPRAVTGGVHNPETEGIFLDSKYPLQWNEILGKILHQLMYESVGSFACGMPIVNNLPSRYR